MKTYPIVCPSCQGSGFIYTRGFDTYNTSAICPACKGQKTVICNDSED